MAKARVDVTCATCGEEFEIVREFRNRREADSYESWAEEHITECPACFKARLAREHTEHFVNFCGGSVPQLTGTEKQIAWANELRENIVANLINIVENQTSKFSTIICGDEPLRINVVKAVKALIATHTDSKYWIDNRRWSSNSTKLIRMWAKMDGPAFVAAVNAIDGDEVDDEDDDI